jgi:ketosteroid isomerase-like protein
MYEQEQSWNNGDIEGFMKHYWQNDSLKFIGRRGLTYGWQQTLDNYKRSYPDRAAMGRLQFDILSTDILSDSSAFVIGKWTLLRSADTLSGHYTLLWKKYDDRWVIVADHSS